MPRAVQQYRRCQHKKTRLTARFRQRRESVTQHKDTVVPPPVPVIPPKPVSLHL